jgi:hypothetical protein
MDRTPIAPVGDGAIVSTRRIALRSSAVRSVAGVDHPGFCVGIVPVRRDHLDAFARPYDCSGSGHSKC